MITVAWMFVAKPERVAEFEARYAADGDWARLFAHGEGYRGTRMLKTVGPENTYLVLDYWDSEQLYADFKEQHRAAYDALDQQCESLTETEQPIGVFPERLVPSSEW